MKLLRSSGSRLAIAIALVTACAGGFIGAAIAGHGATALNANTAASNTTQPPPMHRHGPRFGFGPHGFAGHGVIGTVMGINASNHSFTLRTLFGTVTVDTSTSTTYERERKSISFADITPNDVLAVQGATSGGSDTTPPTSIAASRISVQVPSLAGRVQSIAGNLITMVTSDGQLAYVTTTASTQYYSGRSAANSSAVANGRFIWAEGTRTAANQLNADAIMVPPGNGFGGFGGGFGRAPAAPDLDAPAPFAFGDNSA